MTLNFQGPRVHFQLDTRESDTQLIEAIEEPMRVPGQVTMKSSVKTYNTLEVRNTSESNYRTPMVCIVFF